MVDKKIFLNIGDSELKEICKGQLGKVTFDEIPLLVHTSALLHKIMPIACDRLRSLFNRHKTNLTKSVNAENTVRQASRASAISNNDINFVT